MSLQLLVKASAANINCVTHRSLQHHASSCCCRSPSNYFWHACSNRLLKITHTASTCSVPRHLFMFVMRALQGPWHSASRWPAACDAVWRGAAHRQTHLRAASEEQVRSNWQKTSVMVDVTYCLTAGCSSTTAAAASEEQVGRICMTATSWLMLQQVAVVTLQQRP
jgi:hypothetical protein